MKELIFVQGNFDGLNLLRALSDRGLVEIEEQDGLISKFDDADADPTVIRKSYPEDTKDTKGAEDYYNRVKKEIIE